MSRINLSLIVAVAGNGVIGNKGFLPWRSRADMVHFRETTLGHAVIMGRRTWESLPRRPLSRRNNIVVSRDISLQVEGAQVFGSPQAAVEAGRQWSLAHGVDQIFVIGGAMLYSWALGVADRVYMTEVDCAPLGDVFFPALDGSWRETDVRRVVSSGVEPALIFRTMVRRFVDRTDMLA